MRAAWFILCGLTCAAAGYVLRDLSDGDPRLYGDLAVLVGGVVAWCTVNVLMARKGSRHG